MPLSASNSFNNPRAEHILFQIVASSSVSTANRLQPAHHVCCPAFLRLNESDAETYARAISEADPPFFRRAGIVIEPVTEEQAHAAR